MIENYEDARTKWADDPTNYVVKDSSGNKTKSTVKDSSGNKAVAATSSTSSTNTSSTTKSSGTTYEDLINIIFNKTTFIYILVFLGIYFVAYFGLGFFFNKGGDVSSFQINLSRTLDFLFFSVILILIVSFLYTYDQSNQSTVFTSLFDGTIKFINTPTSIFTVVLFLVVFYIIVYLFRIPMTSDVKPFFISLIENLAWLAFIIISIIDFFQYVLGIPIKNFIANLWNELPNDIDTGSKNKIVYDSSNNKVPVATPSNEVFNISNNLYTYDDAQAICTAYGAKMATYDQMEDAYEKGAEWCNYGWSDGQMIFFPTQKSTWKELQKDPKRKNNCGRPGVNGGYIANPYVKFGVNCFGKKPKPSDSDLARMKAVDVVPKSDADVALDAKVKYWKDHAADLLKINSYNKKQWSEY
uniref:Link domain-containing protein n=1 Tax=viral metagenome TaxID=1070528 RepID=A0A6C0JIY4_9ZZZZ